jgi:lipoyl(octanoyl) transferase
MTKWRLLFTGFNHPRENMAIDEALLENYRKQKIPVFRIYGWQPPGFSIGRFQKTEQVLKLEQCRQDNIPFVRRATGGSIIFHGNEVTYSVICSQEDIGYTGSVKESFKKLCSFIFLAYRKLGFNPSFAVDIKGKRTAEKSSFCFSSYQDYDILINGKKIGGNAQRRIKDTILQHGSIPLDFLFLDYRKYVCEPLENVAQLATCLQETAGRKISFEEFSKVLAESFRETLSPYLKKDMLTAKEKEIANCLMKKKYDNRNWNIKGESL